MSRQAPHLGTIKLAVIIVCPASPTFSSLDNGPILSKKVVKNLDIGPLKSAFLDKPVTKFSPRQVMLPDQCRLSLSTKHNEGDRSGWTDSSWKKKRRPNLNKSKSDIVSSKIANGFDVKIGGRNSQQKRLTEFWLKQQVPTEVAETMVGKRTTQSTAVKSSE